MLGQDGDVDCQLLKATPLLGDTMSTRVYLKPARKCTPVKDKDKPSVLMMAGSLVGSRGSAMLEAARKNRPTDPKQKSLDMMTITESQLKLRFQQQAPRSTGKNKVLFAEPLVTRQFEYEPTILSETDEIECLNASAEDEDFVIAREFNDGEDLSGSKIKIKSIAKHKKSSAGSENASNQLNYGVDSRNNDDDDMFIMASDAHNQSSDALVKEKSPRKRPFEMAALNTNPGDEDFNSNPNGRQDEGLFSSPKIAKIAPYYHQQPYLWNHGKHNGSDLKSAHNHHLNQPPQRPPRSRPSPHRRYRLVHRPLGSCNQVAPPAMVSAPSMVPDIDVDATKELQTGQTNYFSWISSGWNYISSQVNRMMS